MDQSRISPARLVLLGARDTLPLILAAIPFAILFGVLAQSAGLSSWATLGMSMLVFAGSAQFVAITMLAAAAAWPAILLATFFVNLRHMLYSITLIPHVSRYPNILRALMGFWLTDETFAVVSDWLRRNKDQEGFHWYYIGSGLLMYSNWAFCTFIGITLGETLPGMTEWGLEVAMIVAFTGIIAPALTTAPMWASAAAAGVFAIVSYDWPHQSGLILSSIVGVIAALIIESMRKAR